MFSIYFIIIQNIKTNQSATWYRPYIVGDISSGPGDALFQVKSTTIPARL